MLTIVNLLAQSRLDERLSALRGGFNERQSNPADVRGLIFLIVIPVAIVAVILLVRQIVVSRKASAGSTDHPMRLFNTVLRKMGVRLSDRYLLRAFARASVVQHPASLFLSRELFERHARRWLDGLNIKSLQSHARQRFAYIAELAFGPAPLKDESPATEATRLEDPFQALAATPSGSASFQESTAESQASAIAAESAA